MSKGARRLPLEDMRSSFRRALLALCTMLAAAAPLTVTADPDPSSLSDTLTKAEYSVPTTRYPHGVLGDEIEHGALILTYSGSRAPVTIRLPDSRVFEDTAPRVVDIDNDGQSEVVVVESHQTQGARLAIYNDAGLVAATPYIGQRYRWLAPVAVADLDGDGLVELAYIDRPHLAKILRVWRFSNGALSEVATLSGLTNHRIGEGDIAGGLRSCGARSEMIVATGNWQRVMAVTFDGSTLDAYDIGPHQGRSSFAAALVCE